MSAGLYTGGRKRWWPWGLGLLLVGCGVTATVFILNSKKQQFPYVGTWINEKEDRDRITFTSDKCLDLEFKVDGYQGFKMTKTGEPPDTNMCYFMSTKNGGVYGYTRDESAPGDLFDTKKEIPFTLKDNGSIEIEGKIYIKTAGDDPTPGQE